MELTGDAVLNFEFLGGAVTPVSVDNCTGWRRLPFYVLVNNSGAVSKVETPEKTWFVKDGEGYVLQPNRLHRLTNTGGDYPVSVWCHFRLTLYQSIDYLEFFGLPDKFQLPASDRIRECCRFLVTAGSGDPVRRLMHLKTAGFNLVSEITRHSTPRTGFHDKIGILNRLAPALDYMSRNLGKRPSLAEMARRVSLSESRFTVLFKQVMKMAPGEYWQQLRLMKAQEILYGGEGSIQEIAEELGFYDVFHFSRQYKQYFGTTPAEFLRRRRQNESPY